ncbi:DUF998 domain-containing protein [Corynebacterium nuruki]|jgi:hypothetical protein|uniref:DUF998 domain-containing protein n=1 Tax=Corynebacterium nuruki TaxID=1032851 RepID=UPI0002486D4B|nr:DUF998 domain-containing protein [Corynebacterium nuruki]
MITYRTSGFLLLFSGILSWVGQFIGLLRWRGMYSLVENRATDFGVTECTVLRDHFGTRFVCSPANVVVNGLTVLSGLMVAVAAVLIILTARRERDAAVSPTAVLIGLSGLFTIAVGLIPSDLHGTLNTIVLVAHAVALWAAMEVLIDAATRHAEDTGDAHPLIYGAYLPITRVVEFFSVVALLTLVFSGGNVMPGAFERVVYESLTAWTVVFGICLVSLGGAADQERMRVAGMDAVPVRNLALPPAPRTPVSPGVHRDESGGASRRYPGFGGPHE